MPDIYVAPSKTKKKKRKRKKVSLKTKRNKEIKKIVDELGEKRTKKRFTSFMFLPKNITFETQESEEKIIVLLRKHPITNLSWVLITFLMILAPLGLRWIPLLAFLPWRFKFMTVIMWYLITTAFVFEKFLSWYFNVFIITDERIVDVDFVSLAYKEITETKIDKIQDITFTMGGAIRSLFNYGDVLVQTAGKVPRVEFEDVAKPDKVARILNQLILQEEKEKIEGRVR